MTTKTAKEAVEFLIQDGMTAGNGRTTFNPPTGNLIKWLEENDLEISDPDKFETELINSGFHLMPYHAKNYSDVWVCADYPKLQQRMNEVRELEKEQNDDDFWEWVVEATYETIKDGDETEPMHDKEYNIKFSDMIPMKLVFDEYVLNNLIDDIEDDYYKILLKSFLAFDRFTNTFFEKYDYRPLYEDNGNVTALALGIDIDYSDIGDETDDVDNSENTPTMNRQQRRKMERERRKRKKS